MRRKLAVAIAVFALAFTTAGVSIAGDGAPAIDDGVMAVTGINDSAIQGTAWVAERPGKFDLFKHWGWGTTTSVKEVGQEWVHIAIPTPTYIDGTQLLVSHVEFCAKAFRPLKSAPVRMDVWANNVRVDIKNITWPDSTASHCEWINFDPPVWMESVGLSVLVDYGNRKNRVELNKAWARLVPAP